MNGGVYGMLLNLYSKGSNTVLELSGSPFWEVTLGKEASCYPAGLLRGRDDWRGRSVLQPADSAEVQPRPRVCHLPTV